jgi:(2Fe-2S) ferredoxin
VLAFNVYTQDGVNVWKEVDFTEAESVVVMVIKQPVEILVINIFPESKMFY